jgi:hypothetical protein
MQWTVACGAWPVARGLWPHEMMIHMVSMYCKKN